MEGFIKANSYESDAYRLKISSMSALSLQRTGFTRERLPALLTRLTAVSNCLWKEIRQRFILAIDPRDSGETKTEPVPQFKLI